jgi:hypothetical protein
MMGHRRRVPWVLALTAALLLPGTAPAGAHEHPTPIERAAPAVVYVEARAEVEVSLVEHRQSDPAGVHIAIIQSTSNPLLASASGFVVDPTGAIVTSGAITQTDLDLARIYAVNEAFQKQYGIPMPADPFARQQVGAPTDVVEQRLEACYPPHTTNDAGGCVVRVTPTYVVYPYVSSQEEYGRLPAELRPGSTPDVAVLQVRGATSMPTVALGESMEGAQALAVLGFTGIPERADALQAINSHLAETGGTVLKSQDLTEAEAEAAVKLAPAVKDGLRGGPVLAEQGQVIGFLEPEAGSGPPPATAGRLVDAGAIRDVLSADGVTPRRGPVDTSFEAAMHAFKNGGFAAAVPNFKATLALFPGHALAANNRAEAERNVAAGEPGPAPPGGDQAAGSGAGFPWTVVLIAVAVVLLLAAVAMLVLRRRRQASAAGGGTPSPGTPPPREGQHATPSRAATGQRERKPVPSVAPGPGASGVAVIEGGGPRRGGAGGSAGSPSRAGPAPSGAAPSKAVPGQGPAAAAADGSRRASHAPGEPAAEPRSGFCTSCGARLRPQDRFCGRCGKPAR